MYGFGWRLEQCNVSVPGVGAGRAALPSFRTEPNKRSRIFSGKTIQKHILKNKIDDLL